MKARTGLTTPFIPSNVRVVRMMCDDIVKLLGANDAEYQTNMQAIEDPVAGYNASDKIVMQLQKVRDAVMRRTEQ